MTLAAGEGEEVGVVVDLVGAGEVLAAAAGAATVCDRMTVCTQHHQLSSSRQDAHTSYINACQGMPRQVVPGHPVTKRWWQQSAVPGQHICVIMSGRIREVGTL